MTRRRKTVIIVLAILAILAAIRFIPVPPPGLEISRETTYVTEPITADGEVDFAAAINARMSEGVTPETNAMIGLLEALGPGAVDDERVYELLGMEPLPEGGEYFVSLEEYVKTNPPPEPAEHKPNSQDNEPSMKDNMLDQVPETFQATENDPLERAKRALKDFAFSLNTHNKHNWARDYLNANEAALDRIVSASENTHVYYPMLPSVENDSLLINANMKHLGLLRDAATRLSQRAAARLSRGRIEEGWTDLAAVYRLSVLLFNRRGTLVHYLSAISIRGIADNALRRSANADMPGDSVRNLIDRFRALPSLSLPGSESLLADRIAALQALIHIADRDASWAEGYRAGIRVEPNVNRMLRGFNMRFDPVESALTIDDWALRRAALDRAMSGLDERRQTLIGEMNRKNYFHYLLPKWCLRDECADVILSIFTTMYLPVFNKFGYSIANVTADARLTEAVLALRLYHDDHGEYPETLDALAPKYLSDVPLDPFTGKPLAYDRTEDGYMLRSLGEDGKDDGAQEKIRWRMPRAEDA